ncbi:MAG: ABC transporter permease [Thermoleophilia bacterium]|nr:ABC transporter permease [Thermoleophilia bacterium]
MRLFRHEVRTQQLLFWRNKESAVFVFVFPPLLYLLLGAVYSGRIGGFPAADALLVGLVGYGCANTAFAGLAITLVIRREGGVLKRMRATPLPPATYLAAVLTSTLFIFVLQLLVTMTLGVVLYGASGPRNWLGLGCAVLLGVAAFAGLGFGAAALIRSSEGASAVVNLIVLPMAFLSGSFGPTRGYPAFLQAISDVLPLTYLIRILRVVYLGGGSFWSQPRGIVIVLAWGVVGLLIASRRFGWEPRER